MTVKIWLPEELFKYRFGINLPNPAGPGLVTKIDYLNRFWEAPFGGVRCLHRWEGPSAGPEIRTSGWVSRDAVRPGECFLLVDVAAYQGGGYPHPVPVFQTTRGIVDAVAVMKGVDGWVWADPGPPYESFYPNNRPVRLIPRWDADTVTAPVAANSRFPKPCPVCGRDNAVYVGANVVEHDGPCNPQSTPGKR